MLIIRLSLVLYVLPKRFNVKKLFTFLILSEYTCHFRPLMNRYCNQGSQQNKVSFCMICPL